MLSHNLQQSFARFLPNKTALFLIAHLCFLIPVFQLRSCLTTLKSAHFPTFVSTIEWVFRLSAVFANIGFEVVHIVWGVLLITVTQTILICPLRVMNSFLCFLQLALQLKLSNVLIQSAFSFVLQSVLQCPHFIPNFNRHEGRQSEYNVDELYYGFCESAVRVREVRGSAFEQSVVNDHLCKLW